MMLNALINSAGKSDNILRIPCWDNAIKLLTVTRGRGKLTNADYFGYPFPLMYRIPIVDETDSSFLAAVSQDGISIKRYQKIGKQYSITDSYQISTEGNARVTNMKRLESGAILLAWAFERWGTRSYPQFTYFKDNAWTTLSLEWDNLSGGAPWMTADFVESDDGIWYLGHHDSNTNICGIHLEDIGTGLTVLSLDPEFVPQGHPLFCEGEAPYIVADCVNGEAIFAYHSGYSVIFAAPSPWAKGAKIFVTKIKNGEHSLIYSTPDYAERVTPFALVGTSLIYGHMNELPPWDYNEMHYRKSDGSDIILGRSQYPMYFRHSNDYYVHNGLDGGVRIVKI